MENKETVLVLKKPIMIDGEEVKEITYDFENLTGKRGAWKWLWTVEK